VIFSSKEKEREGEKKRNVLCTDAQITVVSIGCSRVGFSRVILAPFQFQAACNNPVRNNVHEKLYYIDCSLFRHSFDIDFFRFNFFRIIDF